MLFNAGLIPSFVLFRDLRLLDNPLVLILPGMISVFNMIIMRNFFLGIPDSLKESAEIDGAGPFTILVKIYLPLSTPVLATIGLFYAVGRWNGFQDALFFMQTAPEWHPIQMLLYNIIENTSLEDWLCEFVNDYNENSQRHTMHYLYDYRTGFLDFSVYGRMFVQKVPFKFVFEDDNHIPFLKFLNQEVRDFPQNFVPDYSFTGVWNRQRIMFHANFCTSKRNYFGCSGDFWPKPSKVYKFNSGISTFQIWFTTDCHNRILPKYSSLIMELVFISNFKTVDPVL
jgi:hypothetical protein